MKSENIRFYIKIRTKLGKNVAEIHNELKSAIPLSAPAIATVRRWYNLAKAGQERVEDIKRSGRKITETTDANAKRISDIIEEDPYCTFEDLVEETKLSKTSITRIVHDKLKLRKLASRWVPHELTKENKEKRVQICQENLAKFRDGRWRLCDVITGDESWFYHRQIGRKQTNYSWVKPGDHPKTVTRISQFEPKTMFTIFFKSNGPVHVSYLEKGQTIDHSKYIESCLKPLVNTIN